MKEIITLNIGQGGIQLGNAIWELLCLEHGVRPDGSQSKERTWRDEGENMSSFFYESTAEKFVPRTVIIDLEPTVVDEIRSGPYRELFHPDTLVSGKEDAANNYARGHYLIGKNFAEIASEKIRKLAETCEELEGFILTHAVGGGTGSGLGDLILSELCRDYDQKTNIDFCIYPSNRLSTSVVEPYNAVLSTHSLLANSDTVFMFDNEAIYHILIEHLDVEKPSFLNINRLIAQTISSLTCSLRFNGDLNVNLADFETNLVPYPRIHFITSALAPLVSSEKESFENLGVIPITDTLFEPKSTMVSCDPRLGKYMSVCTMYRGDVVPKDVTEAIAHVKNKSSVKFVDWCPTGFKVGINYHTPCVVPGGDLAIHFRSACMLSNTTAIKQIFSRLAHKFDLMFAKKAFVHWYVGEGMEQGELIESREDVAVLEKDYEELEADMVITDEP